ncbi:FadR/GntR family transcriptional regulator [Caballeronia sp. LZ043]|uniref:FadR/GntR family transcriptional regulator n=1 Tax=Caballeronia sp. LZ043 TaxID=3038569 RepID=UPI00285F7024|nr:FadR/GntR family transcriptional regulator [Caballeronia sp. LZ043]MDR5823303.1 FadR/GntR family transcriptional regulator [Caballeronia sp. LZ043]
MTQSPDPHNHADSLSSVHASSTAPNSASGTRRSLTLRMVDAVRAQIDASELKAGARLPTEAEMVQHYGVSRTVVREALSRLQAEGLVETRHGIGTFICESAAPPLLQIDPADVPGSLDALAILELRISLETESAGLAALRCDAARVKAMRAALVDFARNVDRQADTVAPDLRFHMEIAQATGNRYFVEIMAHLGARMIPRTRLTATPVAPERHAEYLTRVNREHEQIADAIERGDADSARTAMRLHLINSRERLRRAQTSTD